ncbi:MAG: caspase family protein [Myxococcales bacterium]
MTRSLPLALLLAAGAARADVHRFALVVGDSQGGAGTRQLRYAERDARRIHAILTRLGGVREDDARLLTGADADELRRALFDLEGRARSARERGEETLLLVYYSGHAKDGDLRLRDTRMPLAELRQRLQEAPADVRIGLLDSCQSGAITRMKGVRPAPAFDVQRARDAGPRGLVLIASSASDEESQESDEIAGSFFTHYLASGLLGDADASGDGKVTLAEAYAYAYGRTVGSTAETRAGAQHPVYLYDLGGAGDVVLTELSPARGGLSFGAADEGLYVVLDGQRRAVAEVAKVAGSSRRLALAPGSYIVKKRLEDAVLVGDVKVGDGVVEVADAQLTRRKLEDDPQKGASGPRWSVLGSGGYQFFFDSAARNGLFPPAVLAGAEVSARDDLGHQLAWGVDVAVGGGTSTLRLSGVPDIPVRFGELSGGVSLWRDFDVTERLTVSVGARLAFLYLFRSFSGRSDLPSQNFFTLTPGAELALGWRFSPRWTAVARTRANYLFYNVDKSQSLGYAELALGVDYAFGF